MKCEDCEYYKTGDMSVCDYHKLHSEDAKCPFNKNDRVLSLCLEFIKNIASFFKEYNMDSVLDSFYLFYTMNELGIFSGSDEFVYDTKISEYKSMMFPNIIYGRGCCRHTTDFYRILLNEINPIYNPLFIRGYNSPFLYDYNPGRSYSYKERLNILFSFKDVLLSDYSNPYSQVNFGNHSTLSVSNDGKVVLLDTTNLYAFNFEGKSKCKTIAGKGSFNICGLTYNGLEDYPLSDTLKILNNDYKGNKYSDEELISSYLKVKEFYKKNNDIIEDFKIDNIDLLYDAYSLIDEELSLKLK